VAAVLVDFVAYRPWFATWSRAFELLSSILALRSVEVGFQYYCSHHRCCCGSWPSEEYGLIEISKRRVDGGETMIDQEIQL
jgi:hypothetical protein